MAFCMSKSSALKPTNKSQNKSSKSPSIPPLPSQRGFDSQRASFDNNNKNHPLLTTRTSGSTLANSPQLRDRNNANDNKSMNSNGKRSFMIKKSVQQTRFNAKAL